MDTDGDPPPPTLLTHSRKRMDVHSCAARPFVPCVLRTRLHSIVNDNKCLAGAALAKRKVFAVTTVHRQAIGILDPIGVRVELYTVRTFST
jgi:hypothetical protein